MRCSACLCDSDSACLQLESSNTINCFSLCCSGKPDINTIPWKRVVVCFLFAFQEMIFPPWDSVLQFWMLCLAFCVSKTTSVCSERHCDPWSPVLFCRTALISSQRCLNSSRRALGRFWWHLSSCDVEQDVVCFDNIWENIIKCLIKTVAYMEEWTSAVYTPTVGCSKSNASYLFPQKLQHLQRAQ